SPAPRIAARYSPRRTRSHCSPSAWRRTRRSRPRSTSAGRPAFARWTILSSEKTRRSKCEGEQEYAECHRRRPGRAVERGGEALENAEQHGADHPAGKAAEAAKHADREHAADIIASDRRLDQPE